jgi:hypothetical protein
LSSSSAKGRSLILALTLSSVPVFFAPYDDLSTGIPDGWTGSVLFALFEGLAGIKDKGAAFSHAGIMPRWSSANVASAEIALRYPCSAGYCSYRYATQQNGITIEFTGSAERFDVELLVPAGRSVAGARLNGDRIATNLRQIEDSTYLVLPSVKHGAHRLEVELADKRQIGKHDKLEVI